MKLTGTIEGRTVEIASAAAPDLQFVDDTIARVGGAPEHVIPILQAMQEHFGYLPAEALERVCAQSQITPASVTGVASFYDMFRMEPVGKHVVRVCRGTACHVTGAERVEDAFRRHLNIPHGQDTDEERLFTVEQVACLGCCTLAPVVKMESETFGYASAEKVPKLLHDFLNRVRHHGHGRSTEELRAPVMGRAEIHVGLGSCCMAKGSDQLFHALEDSAKETGADVLIKRVGCVGMCHRTPMVEVAVPGRSGTFYAGLDASQARDLLLRHFKPRGLFQRATRLWNQTLEHFLTDASQDAVAEGVMDTRRPEVHAFLGRQVHIATELFGKVDPLDLEEYVRYDGFKALARCLEVPGWGKDAAPANLSPEGVIDTIDKSGLRGRGGAGFPTGPKWRTARAQTDPEKIVICNGDEGDPGAFMDRMLLESFPFRVIEGMAIAAVAVGAHEGIFYIRHEYPLAVKRVRAAIKLMTAKGWLGKKLLGSEYAFKVSIKEGAGAFVCGEETALIASIEGRRGMPRLRPPFPAQHGLNGHPTVINNVETLAMVPWIVRHGPEAFARYGTGKSRGTKVFALAGCVQRGGLIEIPMGTTVREIVEDIGGGVAPGRRFKAVQIGGPSGGCVPARLADTSVDYESLREVGAIMGSGGLVVLDDTACMVDIARYFLQFTQDQSCGKCTFCRIGTKRMLDLLDRLCTGKANRHHLEELERLAHQVMAGSLCGLGKTAPNPVLSTLRYFRDEYEAHLQGRCPAGKCQALIHYRVKENCTGCTLCAQHCPVNAIPMTAYERHSIHQDLCTRCDACRRVCPHQAIEVS
jgi:NADH-quinone oxidoreductase subunit F